VRYLISDSQVFDPTAGIVNFNFQMDHIPHSEIADLLTMGPVIHYGWSEQKLQVGDVIYINYKQGGAFYRLTITGE
jgi:hypothetical protein